MEINMHLSDPEQNALIGVSPVKRIKNPFYDATELDRQGMMVEAEAIYHELLSNDFNNTVVQAALGMNYAVQGKQGVAHALMTSALTNFNRFEQDLQSVGIIPKADDKRHFLRIKKSELMNAIGTTWKHENKTAKAKYWFERAQAELDSPNADIQNNLATIYINEGSPEKSLPHLETAISVDPNHSQAKWNLSLAYLELGRYGEGFDLYHWGKRAAVRMERNYANATTPEWDGSPGKTVVVYGEQGIGDEIMFVSLLPEMIRDCKQVIFDCHIKLHRLFAASFPDIDIYGTREDNAITWPITSDGKQRYPIEAKIAIGDLPKFYRRKIEDFPGTPYISPTAKAAMHWANKLNEMFQDEKPIIGINWIGGHKKTRVEVRSLTLEQMLPILKQDAHFVSLQYTPCEDEIFEFEQKHGIKIHHWPEASQGPHYDDTGGLLASLDLVITNCSSIVHLAGSMGVPTWVLTPSRPAWRYRLDLDYMPWYGKTVTLFRQVHGTTEWEPVVTEVADKLSELIGAKNEIQRPVQSIANGASQGPTLWDVGSQECGQDQGPSGPDGDEGHIGLRGGEDDVGEVAAVSDRLLRPDDSGDGLDANAA